MLPNYTLENYIVVEGIVLERIIVSRGRTNGFHGGIKMISHPQFSEMMVISVAGDSRFGEG